MDTEQTKLDKLKRQQEQLAARIRKMESAEKTRERKNETRRKILLGALLDRWMRDDEKMKERVSFELQHSLERTVDRRVFGLTPLNKNKVGAVSDGDTTRVDMPRRAQA